MKAIPTTGERGIRFRSRLEAKWARMFTLLRWPWEYEPIDLDGYITDFVLPFPAGPVLVEVKPEMYFDDLGQHVPKARKSGWEGNIIVVGTKMFQDDTGTNGGPMLGWWDGEHGDDRGLLTTCYDCRKHTILCAWGGWQCLHCKNAKSEKGKHANYPFGLVNSTYAMAGAEAWWTQATNLTQWEPRQTTTKAQSAQVRAYGRSLEGMRE